MYNFYVTFLVHTVILLCLVVVVLFRWHDVICDTGSLQIISGIPVQYLVFFSFPPQKP